MIQCKHSQSCFHCMNECFFPLLFIWKLDSLLINHNYFANGALGSTGSCCSKTEPENPRSQTHVTEITFSVIVRFSF